MSVWKEKDIVRSELHTFADRQKSAFYFKKLKLCPIVDDYVIYFLCKFQVKIYKFEFFEIF
jgi:hypothetical protein